MPPKRARARGSEEADGGVVSKKPKAVGRKKGARKMPPPLPAGEVLSDFSKKEWVIGASVGKGGFGEIYLAAPQGSSASMTVARHVIKIVSGGPSWPFCLWTINSSPLASWYVTAPGTPREWTAVH